MRIDHYIHFVREEAPPSWATQLVELVLTFKGEFQMANADLQQRIDGLVQRVGGLTTVVESADALLDGQTQILQEIRDQLENEGVSADQLTALDDAIAAIDTNRQALAQSVAENTPAQEPAPTDPNAGGSTGGSTDPNAPANPTQPTDPNVAQPADPNAPQPQPLDPNNPQPTPPTGGPVSQPGAGEPSGPVPA